MHNRLNNGVHVILAYIIMREINLHKLNDERRYETREEEDKE